MLVTQNFNYSFIYITA